MKASSPKQSSVPSPKPEVAHSSLSSEPLQYTTTADIPVSVKIIDQVIGQDSAVELIRKAAAQKRNVLLVGQPGTGKSMLAQAMAEILPLEKLEDVLVYSNPADSNNPRIRVVPTGEGKKILHRMRLESQKEEQNMRMAAMILPLAWFLLAFVIWSMKWISDIIYAATLIMGSVMMFGLMVGSQIRPRAKTMTPKLLVDTASKKTAPFVEATGSRAGSLLGDVRHDPLQCFYGFSNLYFEKEGKIEEISFIELWDYLTAKYALLVKTNEQGYEFVSLPEKENVYTMGYKNGKLVLSRIVSLNRQPYEGKLVDLKVGNRTLSITPEHKLVTVHNDKEAAHISPDDELILHDELKILASASMAFA